MSYTKQTWVTGDTITADKLNHIEDGIEDSSSSLSSYDLVITTDNAAIESLAANSLHIVKGDILDLEDKIDQGIPVSALLIYSGDWSSTPPTANTRALKIYMPMVQFHGPYHSISFSAFDYNNNVKLIHGVSLVYDIDTGAITQVYGKSASL